MRMRALLALLVIAGMLPVQGGTGANTGRADSGTTALFLDTGGGSGNLSLAAPSSIGSVILGRNMTANFTVGNFSALPQNGLHYFLLNLSLVSLNFSGMQLSCSLRLDYFGNGSLVKVLPFQNYTTSTSMQTEHAIIGENGAIDHNFYVDGLRQGSLRLELARTDDTDGLLEILCGSGEDQSTLSIPYGPPLRAVAGPDRTAKASMTVALNASLSESVDPASTEYLWNFGNGMTGSGEQVTAVYDRPGNYTVTLTLLWNGLDANDTLVVGVTENRPPVADAGLNITKRVGENITFRGGGSDPDGTIVSYSWAFGDGFNASGQNVTHAYGSPGDYAVVLTVRDDGGAEGSDSLKVHVNHPPLITNITASRSGNLVSFHVVAVDPDGTLLKYNWDYGDGSNGTGAGAQPSHRYNASGDYDVRCTVIDEYGDNASATVNVTVDNSAPVIGSFGLSATTFVVNEPVRFRPTVYDADGDEPSYNWNFGDGATSQDQNPTHYYTRTGTFTVTLRVSDGTVMVSRTQVLQINDSTGSGLDPSLLSLAVCGALILMIIIIVIARSAGRARDRAGGQSQPYGGVDPQPYGGVQTQPFGGAQYQPYGGVQTQPYGGQYQPYGGVQTQPYDGQYHPAQAPRPPRAPKAPPGQCPRCGSADLQRFPDGHAKCVSCKKIFFTG